MNLHNDKSLGAHKDILRNNERGSLGCLNPMTGLGGECGGLERKHLGADWSKQAVGYSRTHCQLPSSKTRM